MKKFLLFAAVLLLTFSCSSDSEKSTSSPDPIVGSWKLISQYNVEDGIRDEVPLTVCELMETKLFNNLGQFAVRYYAPDAISGCSVSQSISAYWEKISADTYRFTSFSNSDPDSNLIISFSDNNNTMTSLSYDGPIAVYQLYSRQ